jgi:hypothetical protein
MASAVVLMWGKECLVIRSQSDLQEAMRRIGLTAALDSAGEHRGHLLQQRLNGRVTGKLGEAAASRKVWRGVGDERTTPLSRSLPRQAPTRLHIVMMVRSSGASPRPSMTFLAISNDVMGRPGAFLSASSTCRAISPRKAACAAG